MFLFGISSFQVLHNKNQVVWDFDVDGMDKSFNKGGDFIPRNLVHIDPTAEIAANIYAP